MKIKPKHGEVKVLLTKIIMPSSGQTTNESLIVKWHKKVGDEVKKGDLLFEIETDKATLQIESYGEGYLLAVYHNEGEYVFTGEIVAYVGEKGEKIPVESTKAAEKEEDEYQPIMKKDAAQSKEVIIPAAEPAALFSGKALASPAARKASKDGNVNIDDIVKTTSRQPVKRADVENYLASSKENDIQDDYFIDTTSMRRVIARRMVESVSVAPHFTVTMDIDMTQAILLRQMLNEYAKDSGVKISFNDIIVKCVSKAIEKYPMINSTYSDDKIKVFKNVNFGLAVGMDNGLVVPVVKETNKKSIAQIAGENAANIVKAKSGKLQMSEMSNGTITLSNLGMYGVDCFTAIINQPESCILAVGQISEKPVVYKGEVAVRSIMNITASYDHRVIDGSVGAAFLREVKTLLENPQLLLM